MKGIVCVILLLGGVAGYGQSGKESITMAAYAPGFRDAFSFFNHPSALAQVKKPAAGIYSEQPFLVPGWTRATAAIAIPAGTGNFGFAGQLSAAEDFTETKMQLAYARSLGEKCEAGISIHYNNRSFSIYGNEATPGYAASFCLEVNPKFYTGFRLANAADLSGNKKEFSTLPKQFSAGFAWIVSKLFFVTTSIEKQEGSVNFIPALHYAFDKKLFFRAGIVSAQPGWFIASGIEWKKIVFQFIASMHQSLGLTPGISVLFNGNPEL